MTKASGWQVLGAWLLAVSLLGGSSRAVAAPAAPEVGELEQPDGATLRAVPRGDEWRNWMETPEGYAVDRDREGYWRYLSSVVSSWV